jgi:hypothetical protein
MFLHATDPAHTSEQIVAYNVYESLADHDGCTKYSRYLTASGLQAHFQRKGAPSRE